MSSFFQRFATKAFWLWLFRSPLSRILMFILMAAAFSWVMHQINPMPRLKPDQALLASGSDLWLRALNSVLPAVLAYWVLVRVVERRKVSELAPRKAVLHVPIGWLVGTGIMLLAAGAMALFGAYTIHGTHPDVYLLGPLVVLGLLPGITEEIIARGILFRVVEDGLGTWIALAISAIFFGAGHLANPNATLWSSAAIAIEAGLLLGMAYAWTRSLWFCMALHAAWNFTQGPLLGIPVSGFGLDGWMDASLQGNKWISGGEFGAEASVLTVVICVTIAGIFTRKAIDAGQIKPPFWRRPKVAQ